VNTYSFIGSCCQGLLANGSELLKRTPDDIIIEDNIAYCSSLCFDDV